MSPVSPPPPWKIKVVEPIALVSAGARRIALDKAGYNTFLLRSDDVFVDLLTDSGTSALSQEQRAAMELGDESYAGSRSFFRLEAAMRDVYGYQHLIPTHQGRGAEHLLARMLVTPGQLVPSNLYFTTSRAHVELAGGVWVDVSVPEASDPSCRFMFKGNIVMKGYLKNPRATGAWTAAGAGRGDARSACDPRAVTRFET